MPEKLFGVPADEQSGAAKLFGVPADEGPAQERPWIGQPRPANESLIGSIFHAPAYGVQDIGAGVKHLMEPGQRLKGAHEVISGAGRAAIPFIAPAVAAYGAPAVLSGMASSAVGSTLGNVGSRILGADEDVSNLVGDVGGIVGGGMGASAPGQAAMRGAASKVVPETTNLLENWRITNPLKMIPDVLRSAREVYRGGVQGLRDYNYAQTPKTANAVAPIVAPKPQEFAPTPASLPSGRTGPAAPRPEAPRVGRVVAPVPAPQPQEFTPAKGISLPTGRVPGGFANQVPATPAETISPEILDKIAQGFGHRNFKSALPSEQATIRTVAANAGKPAAPSAAAPAYTPRSVESYLGEDANKITNPKPSVSITMPTEAAEEVVSKVEHPPFAKNRSYPASQKAREQAPQPTSETKATTLSENLKAKPEAMKFAKKMKRSLGGK